MRFDTAELLRVSLPLVAPFRTSAGVETVRDLLLVHLEGPDGDGWGECAALSEPTYTAEYVDGATHVTRHHLLPRLAAAGDVAPADVGAALAAVKGHPMAKAAIETAVLDAELRAAGVSLAAHLGATATKVPAGVAVGMAASVPELLDAVDRYIAQGYRRVKLKIGPGSDVDVVRAVRRHIGDGVALQVDANGAYTLADARHLAGLDAYDLLCIEQPLADDDLAGHAELGRHLATPICLDESITSAAAAIEAIERGACRVVNVKAGRVGGYLEARKVHDACRARDVPVWCGGMLEGGLGRAANLALAALPGFSMPGDLSASDRYFARDLTAPFTLDDGYLHVPTGPGVGVRPDPDVLAATTTWSDRIALA